MEATGAVALISGANRGIGKAFVEKLVSAGARKIYAGARDVATLADLTAAFPDVVVPTALDITSRDSIERAAAVASDITLLVNNAGVLSGSGITASTDFDGARAEMEVNYFGLLEMSRAFSPALIRNAPGAIVNVLSIVSLITLPTLATYAASKAAALAVTRTVRAELAPKRVQVIATMPGYVETEMIKGLDVTSKISAETVVAETIAALTSGEEDVFPGEQAASLAAAFFADAKGLERYLAGFVS